MAEAVREKPRKIKTKIKNVKEKKSAVNPQTLEKPYFETEASVTVKSEESVIHEAEPPTADHDATPALLPVAVHHATTEASAPEIEPACHGLSSTESERKDKEMVSATKKHLLPTEQSTVPKESVLEEPLLVTELSPVPRESVLEKPLPGSELSPVPRESVLEKPLPATDLLPVPRESVNSETDSINTSIGTLSLTAYTEGTVEDTQPPPSAACQAQPSIQVLTAPTEVEKVKESKPATESEIFGRPALDTKASAPPASMESVHDKTELSSECSITAPQTLPFTPQQMLSAHLENLNIGSQNPVEAESSSEPTAEPTSKCMTLSTQVKVPRESVSSPTTHQCLYPYVPLLESPVEGRFQPMSLEELQQLYYNPQLQANALFVDHFIQKEEKKTTHEFYEIVMNYFRSRKNLLNVEENVKLLRQQYDQTQSELWVIHKRNANVEGMCGDGNKVSKVHTFEQCELNQDSLSSLATCLQSIRSDIQKDLALFAYSAQMSRLQVESYLHLLFSCSPHLRDMPRNSPVIAMEHKAEEVLLEVEKLQECISVLFVFHRKPIKDEEFQDNIRRWTERLVAALLRVATYKDHLFLLNHVMRAPAGVGRWACGFIQIPGPATLAVQTTLGSPVLDHAVTCLATVLLPVKAREEFLCQMKFTVTEQSLQADHAWTLLDSDGEEDEDPCQSWVYLLENDVVSILQQFPLDTIFAHLLQAPIDESGVVHYDVRRCTEPTMMKLFAFCTTWISLLGAGLHTFSMARYKQLNKRLGRLIRQTIAFVSDHWLNFKNYYGPLAPAASLEHLQLEFDQLFMRATYTILTAKKLGSWQFMADMPFTCLSAGSVWRLLWLLQQGPGQPIDFDTVPPVEKCKEDMKDIESRRQLADALQNLPTSESIYLLTTFANMATARPLEEDEFIECITLQVFEIAYMCDHTRDFCSKTGRELLSSIIQKHPTALSMLLRRVQGVMAELGKMSLYLFSEMPASIWIPQDPDMVLLRQWLLNNDLGTPENQMARIVIDRMNWDLFTETGKLVLDIRLHRQMALLVVEAYVKYISERRASFFIIEGMKQMASYAYTSQGSREQQFNNWAWGITLRLKLHREAAILHSHAAESIPFQAPSLESEQRLLPLAAAARNKNPLACFMVLSMTDVGHETSQFISVGLDMLLTLTMSNQYSAVIHVLSCIIPQFITTPQYLLENETFQKILQMILSADESVLKVTKMVMGAEFKAGTITLQFTQMLQAMICARLEHNQALPLLLFWVQAIFKVAHFLTDMSCCYVLDHLVRWGYLQKGARDKLDAIFRQYHKLHAESKSRGGFLNWMGGSSSMVPSLMEKSSMPEFGWLATQVLNIEDMIDQECGVWPGLQQELLSNPALSLENALKNVLVRIKPEYPRTVGRLSIYRWAQQALDMPISHPIMPIVWQKFFSLYLGRSVMQAQYVLRRMPTRASVGERFFQSMSMSSMLKRLKKKLAEAAEFHLKYDPHTDADKKDVASPPPVPLSHDGSETDTPVSSPLTEESPQYVSSKEFHNQLARLYQTLSLWLEEPRLHGADLYLPALPLQYEPSRLMHIFAPGNSPWLEFVDFLGAQYDISLFGAEWRKLVLGRPQFGSRSASLHGNSRARGQRTAKERILERLQRYTSPKSPPGLQPVVAPVPDISPTLLLDKMAFLHLLDSDLGVLKDFTKFFSSRAAQQCAIDEAFLELIPGQYSNVARQAKVLAECRSRVNPLHRCSNPAVISVRVEEREVSAVVQRKMDENRAEYKQLMIEAVLPPPQNVCIATVHVENAITLLIKLSQSTTDPAKHDFLNDIASTLFFHLTLQVCEESNFYPPTRQFFASCVEILGQEFVSRSSIQTPLLLQFSLDNPGLAGMVAPHFVPVSAPQNFVSMYEQLITVLQQQNLNLIFMLLSKFDVWAWLEECRPPMEEKKRFLGTVGSALMSCGAEPAANIKLVFDLYLGHLKCIVKHQFPSNLSSVMTFLLKGSSTEELHTSCWEIVLLECCAALRGTMDQEASSIFSNEHIEACSAFPVPTEQLQNLLQCLGAFFNHLRRTQPDLSHFGLYPRLGRYVPYLSLLMGLLTRCFVAKVLLAQDDQNPFQGIHIVWHQQLDLWQAWMESMPLNVSPGTAGPMAGSVGEMTYPWTEGDSSVAVTMVQSFKSTLLFIHATLSKTAPQYSSSILSLLLMHYLTKLSHRYTLPHVTDVLVAEFSQLPWELLKPDLQLLETMAQMKEHCAPSCFHLIGHVMTRVLWTEVIFGFKAHQSQQVVQRLMSALLLLLVQNYGDVYARELPEMAQLLTVAEQFDWTGLTMDAFRIVSFWFLQTCQPEWVLAQRSSLPFLGFRLMKAAAEFTPVASLRWTADISMKRLTYIHCVTQQLCQMTYKPQADLETTSTVVVNLLSEIETVESTVADVRCQEEESLDLMKEILSLLNNSNPDGKSQDMLLQTLRQWLHSSPHSILLTPCIKAASRCLASLTQMVQVTETCIQVYFTAYTKNKEEGRDLAAPAAVTGWEHILAVFQVPELNISQYIQEAIDNGAFLMLYALLLHKRPLCQNLTEEAKLMEEVLDWTSHAIPSAENEAKLLLWWLEFCQMWLHQIDAGASLPLCIIAVQRLVVALHQLGEDRATTGFLGVIGFGRRSQLSLKFRLAVRSISAFLSSQVLSEIALRFEPSTAISELPMAKQCRSALTSLRNNKMYAPLKDSVDSMIGFVHRSDHTVRSVLDLIRELSLTLYSDCDYVTASVK